MNEGPQNAHLTAEDEARATCYALISRLFYAAPDAPLLERLRGTRDDQKPKFELALEELPPSGYPAAVLALQQAARESSVEAVRQEYDDLFVGAGRAVVTPYTSGYAEPNAPDRHLVALREHLAAWGLVRRDAAFEVEDHVSAVCDVMRWLIEHNRPIEVQLRFFDEFVFTGVGTFCDAIDASSATAFYQSVAALARAFLRVEKEAFDLHTSE